MSNYSPGVDANTTDAPGRRKCLTSASGVKWTPRRFTPGNAGRDPNDPHGLVNTKRRLRRDRPAQGQN